MSRIYFLLAATVFVLCITVPSFADSTLLFTTPASAGMGGAFGAVADDNSAIILNPAGISVNKRYGTDIGYLYGNSGTEHRLDLSVVDSITSPLGVGIAYYRDSYNQLLNKSLQKIQRTTYAFAMSMGKPGVLSFGITGRRDHFTQGISGESETLGYGIIFSPGLPFLNLSIAGLNLTRIKGSPEQLPPRLIDAGISLLLHGILTVAFDAVKNLDIKTGKNIDYHAGGQVLLVHQIAVRAGYAWQETMHDKSYAAGIAWYAPRFKLAYTYTGDVGNQEVNRQLISFTLYPF